MAQNVNTLLYLMIFLGCLGLLCSSHLGSVMGAGQLGWKVQEAPLRCPAVSAGPWVLLHVVSHPQWARSFLKWQYGGSIPREQKLKLPCLGIHTKSLSHILLPKVSQRMTQVQGLCQQTLPHNGRRYKISWLCSSG